MSEKKNLLITAEEAKKLSSESNCSFNRLAKEIETAAKENRNIMYWCVYETDPIAIEKMLNALNGSGYVVEKLFEDPNDDEKLTTLIIKW